jgi:hypothetical protein
LHIFILVAPYGIARHVIYTRLEPSLHPVTWRAISARPYVLDIEDLVVEGDEAAAGGSGAVPGAAVGAAPGATGNGGTPRKGSAGRGAGSSGRGKA